MQIIRILLLLLMSTSITVAQDISGATVGAISTTMHSNQTLTTVQKKKRVYVYVEEEKVKDTYVKYRGTEYQVYKSKGKFYFYVGKQRKYFKLTYGTK